MPSCVAPCSIVIAEPACRCRAGRRSPACASASQCVADCRPVSILSSLVWKSPGSPVNANDATVTVCFGFSRPMTRPVCGPSACIGIDSENDTPAPHRGRTAPHRGLVDQVQRATLIVRDPSDPSSRRGPPAPADRRSAARSAALLVRVRVLLAQLVLEHLAGRVARQHVDRISSCSGIFCTMRPSPLRNSNSSVERRRVRPDPSAPRPARTRARPERGSGRPITAASAICGRGEEEILDLLRRDVLALADDHVLQPAGDRDVARLRRDCRDRRCGRIPPRRTPRRRATRRRSPSIRFGPLARISPSSPGPARRAVELRRPSPRRRGSRGPRCRRASGRGRGCRPSPGSGTRSARSR